MRLLLTSRLMVGGLTVRFVIHACSAVPLAVGRDGDVKEVAVEAWCTYKDWIVSGVISRKRTKSEYRNMASLNEVYGTWLFGRVCLLTVVLVKYSSCEKSAWNIAFMAVTRSITCRGASGDVGLILGNSVR
jgi:hypothetical protein